MDLTGLGKVLLATAAVIAVLGGVLVLMGRGVLRRIPGTLSFGGGNVRVFVPIGVCVVASIVLTVVLNLFARR